MRRGIRRRENSLIGRGQERQRRVPRGELLVERERARDRLRVARDAFAVVRIVFVERAREVKAEVDGRRGLGGADWRRRGVLLLRRAAATLGGGGEDMEPCADTDGITASNRAYFRGVTAIVPDFLRTGERNFFLNGRKEKRRRRRRRKKVVVTAATRQEAGRRLVAPAIIVTMHVRVLFIFCS